MMLLAVAAVIAGCAGRQQVRPEPPAPPAAEPTAVIGLEPALGLEPKAIELLQAASHRLASARSMSFTAVVSYENPSLFGAPLVYTTKSDVTLKRPDKLRVITAGDGPASEFYYDGKTLVAYTPAENLVAVTAAPPSIDEALRVAYDSASTYFPFTDLIVADPYADIAGGLKVAFYIGQSRVVGGTTTDMVAYANDEVFVQIWIGAEDKLPRMLRAVYVSDPARLRHQMELANWRLDAAAPAGTFVSASAAGAKRINFARPDPPAPPRGQPAETK
jgi:hypothetical protein